MQNVIEVTFPRHRVVPLPVELGMLPSDAMSMFRAWVLAYMDEPAAHNMWVPVGRVGPMVLLGHHDPENAPLPSYPLWAFGLARIPESIHRRLREQAAERLSSNEDQVFDFAPLADSGPPADKRAIIELLLTFPGAQREASSVRSALDTVKTDEELLASLPPGWREATLSIASDLPVVDLNNFFPASEAMALVPDNFAREHDLVPLGVAGDHLMVACPVPAGSREAQYIHSSWKVARESIAQHLRLSLVLSHAGGRTEIERRLAARGTVLATGLNGTPPGGAARATSAVNSAASARTKFTLTRREFEGLSLNTPTIDDRTLLRLALYRAIEVGASDLHIDTAGGAGRMRVRRDNFMRPLGPGAFAINRLAPLIQILRVNIDANGGDLNPVDGKFAMRCDDTFYDVRVSILPAPDSANTGHGYAVLRFLPKDGEVRMLGDLHMGKDEQNALLETLDKPHGIVLVTGPTGSGKTTTLNALVQQLNRGLRPGEEGALKILTAEDPVEYTIDGVQQINVSKQISFAEAIRRFLRQDPDVILVGEIRDLETAEAAITAARTGHLVFSTLHTNGAAETISRLIDMGIPPYSLEALLTLVAQRLVPRLCPNCKVPRAVTEGEARRFTCAKVAVPAVLHEPSESGCPRCDKGWKGRIPVLEIVKVNKALHKAISRRAPEHELREICQELGYRTLHQQALLKVAHGETALRQAEQLNGGWD